MSLGCNIAVHLTYTNQNSSTWYNYNGNCDINSFNWCCNNTINVLNADKHIKRDTTVLF